MEKIQSYMLTLGGFLIFQGLFEGILPSHVSRKYIQLVTGAVFLLILVRPLLGVIEGETEIVWWQESAPTEEYKERVEAMTEKEYAQILKEKGGPGEWSGQWEIVHVTVECDEQGVPEKILVKLSGIEEESSFGYINLGEIGAGASSAEKKLEKELATYWGVTEKALQVRIV